MVNWSLIVDVAGWADEVAAVDRVDHILRREVVRAQAVGIDVHDDRSNVATKGRRRRDARQAGEHRPDPEEGEVVELPDRAGLAFEDQVADGQASGIQANHVRRQRPRPA